MGGTESSLVQLAEALARRGHDVCVFNGVSSPRNEFGVNWRPFAEAQTRVRSNIGIAVATPKAFRGLSFRSRIFWLHNPLKSWRQIRRGSVWPLLMARPTFVLLGDYHAKRVPGWLPSSGREIIYHGIHEDFFRKTAATIAPPPRALFTSQPYRGLDWLLGLWPAVKRRAPGASFHVFAPKCHQAEANARRRSIEGVTFRESLPREALIAEFATARVQLVPGHRDETYCLAAAEATAAGVPIVTLGEGALAERVSNGKTGFVVRDKSEFIARTISLLTDDALWLRMHRACLAETALTSWDDRARSWEALFEKLNKAAPLARVEGR